MVLKTVSLDDKYDGREGSVYITGTQALVRAAMMQHIRDMADGLKTGCFISGYRGSPMHNLDKELWAGKRFLPDFDIHFLPAINEDLAATAIWGTQQAGMFGDGNFDGVFSIWYGKGPGIDRSIDAIRHGHQAGSSQHGGVLCVVGDDHALSSTDSPAAHEPLFADLLMPVLYPANVQEVIDYALYGWALSRFSGCWVGLKLIPDTVDAVAPIDANPMRPAIVQPNDVTMPPDGLNIRFPDSWKDQEPRSHIYKIPAAIAFARANGINRITQRSAKPRFGIIASGKAWTDARQALVELGLDGQTGAELGISMLKIGMPWPADEALLREFADGLEEVFVVEEKHPMMESQLKSALYQLPDGRRPRIIGQHDDTGTRILPIFPEFTPEDITRVIAKRISHFYSSERIDARLSFLDARAVADSKRNELSVTRLPYFCSGCPHNSSTKVPDGSRAHGGVGCHYMSTYMDRNVLTHCHMGGEGLTWVGQEKFVKTEHVFQNLGDGTYYHSGILAIRACVAAESNITFKVLFNDAVAMTGGQPIDGPLTPMAIAAQVAAEGVKEIAVVTDEPEKYPLGAFSRDIKVEHRQALDRVQRQMRETKGVTVIIYDQTCAAEKRRRRKRGQMVDPPRRMLINDLVCEGCGDCNEKSNCLSVVPLDTTFGRKRQIDQSACNKDFSCADGFCPSFVSVMGGEMKRTATTTVVPAHLTYLPEPNRPQFSDRKTYSVLVAGVGGTGVVTIGALLTMGAHMEGNVFSTVDQFGMAQKGGAVTSHIRLAATESDITAVKLNLGAADLVLGCDSLVTGGEVALATMSQERTQVIVNSHEQITGHFTRNPDLKFPSDELGARITEAAGHESVDRIDATKLATRLLGDSIATNLFMLGYAYQRGLIPVSSEAIFKAIELNGVAIDMNKSAFDWGRRAVLDMEAVRRAAESTAVERDMPATLEEIVAHRSRELTAYQNGKYAIRYQALVETVRKAEKEKAAGMTGLAEAVARYGYKLMAYKDEYEVARLYTDGRFEHQLQNAFQGDFELKFHLAPPILTKLNQETGLRDKRTYGGWIFSAMRVLAKLKFLRGTSFDFCGWSGERRMERQLAAKYETTMLEVANGLNHDNHALALQIANVPERIRGYGHVKEKHLELANHEREALLETWRQPLMSSPAAAE